MKKVWSLAAVLILATSVFAGEFKALQPNESKQVDLTGKWSGKRYQYSWDKKSIIQTFEYEFELVQDRDGKITGTTTIINPNGEYADMKVRGILVGNTLHFEEYEITGEIKPENMLWCYKSGSLTIGKQDGRLKIMGATASHMSTYYYPCSGGFTDLTLVDDENNIVILNYTANAQPAVLETSNTVNVFPNPFMNQTTVSYTLGDDAKVALNVIDINGNQIAELFNGSQKKGAYSHTFNANAYALPAGVYIAVLKIGKETYSNQMVLVR